MDVKLLAWLLFIVIFYGWFATAMAADKISVQPGVLQFQYQEIAENGSRLNSEQGVIPGLEAKYEKSFTNHAKMEVSVGHYSNDIRYNGFTQAGIPHQTRTDETLRFYSADIFIPLPIANDSFYLKTGLGRREWGRDILSADNVPGLYEKYTWYEVNVGLDYFIYKSGAEEYSLYAGLIRIVKPRIEIDLTPWDYGKPTLELEERTGFEIGSDWIYSINNNWQFGMAFSYQYWEFGRSDDKIVSNNLGSTTIAEPDSETRIVAFHLIVISNF